MIFQVDNVDTIPKKLRESMLSLRKRVFCDNLGWDIPHCAGMEADIFDFTNSFYINMVRPQTGELLSSVRLMPVAGNNLLSTVFHETLESQKLNQYKQDLRVWEGARLCVNEVENSSVPQPNLFFGLLIGLFKTCEHLGIKTLVCNCDSIMYRRYRSMGLDIDHLGKTTAFRHGSVHCLSFDISKENLHALMLHMPDSFDDGQLQIVGEGIQHARNITQWKANNPISLGNLTPHMMVKHCEFKAQTSFSP